MTEFEIGKFAASALLSVILRLIYSSYNFGDKIKPWIAIFAGIVLGIIAMFYRGETTTFAAVVDYIAAGFMLGATAVGLYEITRRNP